VFYRGKEGRPTPISANYLRLETAEGKGVFEYEVRFEPRVDSREARFKLLNSLREITGTTKVDFNS
jgi:aubergine-like protein